MSAPDLWGIDPDCLYRWTPRSGREVIKEAVKDDKGDIVEAAVYGKRLPGAPAILVAAPLEVLASEIEVARRAYRKALSKAIRVVGDGTSPEEAREEALDKIDESYSDNLIRKVLSACVKGFDNVCRPDGKEIAFTGDWAKDSVKIPTRWKAELFQAIIDETAFSSEQIAPFTSPLGSQPG